MAVPETRVKSNTSYSYKSHFKKGATCAPRHLQNLPGISRRANQYTKQTNPYLPMFCDENIWNFTPS